MLKKFVIYGAVIFGGLFSGRSQIAMDVGVDRGAEEFIKIEENYRDRGDIRGVASFWANCPAGRTRNLLALRGSSVSSCKGAWEKKSDQLVSRDRRGEAEYRLKIPFPNLYRLAVNLNYEWYPRRTVDYLKEYVSFLDVYVDGVFCERLRVDGPVYKNRTVYAYLPYLRSGEHKISVFWENDTRELRLAINRLRLQYLTGADTDQNGIRDWIDRLMVRENRVESPIESFVSPVCIEGIARFPGLVRVEQELDTTASADFSDRTLSVRQGVGNHWFLNMPLNAKSPSRGTIWFENRAYSLPVAVDWVPYYLDQHDGQVLTVRQGVSVQFLASEHLTSDSQCRVTCMGRTYRGADSVKVTFSECGIFRVDGIVGNDVERTVCTVHVNVIGRVFPEDNPACIADKERIWVCPDMTEQIVLDHDRFVQIDREGDGRVILKASRPYENHTLVARYGEGGPILDSVKLDVMLIQPSADPFYVYHRRYPDYDIWGGSLLCRFVPDSVSLRLDMASPGVVFSQFETRLDIPGKEIPPAGLYPFELYHSNDRSGSAGYIVRVFQGDQLIGSLY